MLFVASQTSFLHPEMFNTNLTITPKPSPTSVITYPATRSRVSSPTHKRTHTPTRLPKGIPIVSAAKKAKKIAPPTIFYPKVQRRAESYIQKASSYDLFSTLHKNPASSSDADSYITMKLRGVRLNETQKSSIICTIGDLGAADVGPQDRDQIMNAVIHIFSHWHIYQEPCISIDYVRKMFQKFKKSLLVDPFNTYRIYMIKADQGRNMRIHKIK